MKIIMLSWEFPPRIVGGISRHCFGLSRALARMGHEVRMVTLEFPNAPDFEEIEGIKVHRVRIELGHPNFLTWTLLFNHFMEKFVLRENFGGKPDIIHAHDWLVSPSSIAIKYHFKRPLISTIHSTEVGRRHGLSGSDSYNIDGFEWWLTYEASKVITASEAMRWEVTQHFKLPAEKVVMIPNGIDMGKFNVDFDRNSARSRYVANDERMILFIGRLTPQKGTEYLLRALPLIHRHHPKAKLVIVGDGWLRENLVNLARSMGYSEKVYFTGFLPEDELVRVLLCADVLVAPSIYEPFGIVALEGMAAGVPVVASNVGGLGEIIRHGETGVLTYPADPDSIAWGVNRILSNDGYARRLIEKAKGDVSEKYSWEVIAQQTVRVYEGVIYRNGVGLKN